MHTSLVNLNDICIYVCDFVCNIHTFEILFIVFALYPLTHNGYYSVHVFFSKHVQWHINFYIFFTKNTLRTMYIKFHNKIQIKYLYARKSIITLCQKTKRGRSSKEY